MKEAIQSGINLIKNENLENGLENWRDEITPDYPYVSDGKHFSQLIKVKPNTTYLLKVEGSAIEININNLYKARTFSATGVVSQYFRGYGTHPMQFTTSFGVNEILLTIVTSDNFLGAKMIELESSAALVNPDFNDCIKGWTYRNPNLIEIERKLCREDDVGAHLHLIGVYSSEDWISQTVKLKADTSYKLILWKKSDGRLDVRAGIYRDKELIKQTKNLASENDFDVIAQNKEIAPYRVSVLPFKTSTAGNYDIKITVAPEKAYHFNVYLVGV